MARRDEAQFRRFVAEHSSRLRRTAFLLCGDWDRAEDLVQETFVRVYLAWPRLTRRSELGGYARQTLVNVAVDAARRRSSTEVPREDADGRDGRDERDGRIDRAAGDPATEVTERVVLVQALSLLPPRQRACVVLRFYEDWSVAEVAETLGCRTGTVKSQTARGLEALRAACTAAGLALAVGDPASTEART